MPNTIKKSTVLWALGALLAPFILASVMSIFGVYLPHLSIWHIWLISLPLCGYFAYRSYKRGAVQARPMGETVPVATAQPVALSGSARFGMAVLGAAVGFGVGYLTRPTFLGQKLPLGLLFEPAPPEFAQMHSDYIFHMVVATGIGFVAALALTFLVASLRKA